jgi:hypothetical protein
MERACNKYETRDPNHTITYLDCLTMFCGESGQFPGAVLGGKAIPEKMLFDYDQLHLSREGYQIWKGVVEGHITALVARVASSWEGTRDETSRVESSRLAVGCPT